MMLSVELFLFLIVPCICTERRVVLWMAVVLETELDSRMAVAGPSVDCLGFPMEATESSTDRILLLSQGLGTPPWPLLAVQIESSPQSEEGVQGFLRPFLGLGHNRCQGHSPECMACS